MVMKFENLKEYFEYHRKDKKVTVIKVAESLDISASYLYMLIAKTRNASYPLACKIEELLNVQKESVLKKISVHKSCNWRKNIFRKQRRK